MSRGVLGRLRCVIAALALAGSASVAHAQLDGQSISIGQATTIQSRLLDEDRVIAISEPVSYGASDQAYAVLYVLDGLEHFAHIASLAQFLASAEQIPEVLVVGIGNTDRSRDFYTAPDNDEDRLLEPTAGGADAFIRFLDEELVPLIDSNYRTTDYRILFGHSAGGFLSIYSMLTRPNVFDAYIAASPSAHWNDEQLRRMIDTEWNGAAAAGTALYMSQGEEGADGRAELDRLTTALRASADTSLRWAYEQMAAETHASMPHLSAYRGLRFVFDGWFVNDALDLYETVGIAGIHEHFRKLDQMFGYRRGTPRSVIQLTAQRLFEAGRLDEVGDIILYDVDAYPTHPQDINRLADAYLERGESGKAIEFYSLSLRLSPGNVVARRQLTGLGVDVDALVDETAPDEATLQRLAGRYQMPNGSIFEFRAVDRGMALVLGGAPNELIVQSTTQFTFGPGLLFFDFSEGDDAGDVAMRVRTPTTNWEETVRLD